MGGFGRKRLFSQKQITRRTITPSSSRSRVNQLWNQYSQSALPIRGTDGQIAISQASVRNYINSDRFNFNVTNPWNNFTSTLSPSFSASLLSQSAKYPILWYVYSYVDPFYQSSNNTTPPLQSRSQGAFTLSNFQFAGASLWDGDSNADITGSTTIPSTFDTDGNRGTDVNGYSIQLPFVMPNPQYPSCKIPVGTATFNCPTTNNTNKAYNPTFNATNSGEPISGPQVNTIMKNLCKVKGEIWERFIPTDERAPCGRFTGLAKSLLDNWGTGFEIEGYVFPMKYQSKSSIWLDPDENNNSIADSRFNVSDTYSINIATDSISYEQWLSQHSDPDVIGQAYRKIYQDAVSGAGTPDAQWINKPKTGTQIPLTLITGVMLPAVQLTGAGGKTATEFCQYLRDGYGPLKKSNFLQVGLYDTEADRVTLFTEPLRAS